MTIPFCSVEEDKADKEHFENVSVREKTLTEQVAARAVFKMNINQNYNAIIYF